MKNSTLLSAVTIAFAFALASAGLAQASPNSGQLQERVKVALNGMVQEVKAAETPAAKREVMERFLNKVDRSSRMAERLPLGEENRAALNMLKGRFAGYSAELAGTDGQVGVPDGDLDAFAGFMQQDLEQAAVSGGVYLSTGAIIIVLLILILLL
jgi:hypothetical protein